MIKRKTQRALDSIWDAVVRGNAAAVRQLIDAGSDPDEHEDVDDPTPLMYAAASGQMEIVELLVSAGAEVDAPVEFDGIDLPADCMPDDQPADSFLDELTSFNATGWLGWSAPVYAAVYGRSQVLEFLLQRATTAVQQQAQAVFAARQASEAGPLRPKPARTSGAAAARAALLSERPKLSRWVVQCILCGKQGYDPKMPAEIDREGTARTARRLFAPLVLRDYFCQRCLDKVEKGRRAAQALLQQQMASLPPHVKVQVVQPRAKKKRNATGG